MKSISITVLFITLLFNLQVIAQDEKEADTIKVKAFEFTDVISIENTSVKNQYRSGTCWSFFRVLHLWKLNSSE